MFDAEEEGEVHIQYDIGEGEKVQIRGIRLVQHHTDGTIVDSEMLLPRNPRRPEKWVVKGPMPQQLCAYETKTKHWWRKESLTLY